MIAVRFTLTARTTQHEEEKKNYIGKYHTSLFELKQCETSCGKHTKCFFVRLAFGMYVYMREAKNATSQNCEYGNDSGENCILMSLFLLVKNNSIYINVLN